MSLLCISKIRLRYLAVASVVPMDWRTMSRSRSRISMDWRPTSRSRSRPPEAIATFDQHGMLTSSAYDGRFIFPSSHDSFKPSEHTSHKPGSFKAGMSTSPSIPIPGSSVSMLSPGRRTPPYHPLLHPHSDLTSVYEDQSEGVGSVESRFLHPSGYNHTLSSYHSPVFSPSSLPSSGLHGLAKVPSSPHGPEHPAERTFPRHVRKTSFDHTVSKDGILAGLSGRHQVNGKPIPPDNLIGTKRRAETPHYESMLRADPSIVDGSSHQESDHLDSNGSPFPSSSFNFSFPPYEGLFSLPAPSSSVGSQREFTQRSEGRRGNEHQYHHPSSHSSIQSQSYQSTVATSHNTEGLSAAAAAASAVMAEGYAQLNAANLATGVDDGGLDYGQLLSLVYPGLDSPQNPYTHVDPTQLLSTGQGDTSSGSTGSGGMSGLGGLGGYSSFHESPSSDGWGNGVGSSSTTSPEPHNASNASTPPSTEGTNTGGSKSMVGSRKYIPLKQGTQDSLHRRKSLSTSGSSNSPTELRSPASTPDLSGMDRGVIEEGDQAPTLCTNCQTTNTPLWRRDPEGQPLCTYKETFSHNK